MVVAKREKIKNSKKSKVKCHRVDQSCTIVTEKQSDQAPFQSNFNPNNQSTAKHYVAPTTMPFSVDHILGFTNSTVSPMAVDPNYAYYRSGYHANDFRYSYPQPYFGLGRLDWLQANSHFSPIAAKTDASPTDEAQRIDCGQKKRRISRCPRIPFSKDQLNLMEDVFQQQQYLSPRDIENLCRKLDLKEHRVKNWFQNRRAREKRARTSSSITILANQFENATNQAKNENDHDSTTVNQSQVYIN